MTILQLLYYNYYFTITKLQLLHYNHKVLNRFLCSGCSAFFLINQEAFSFLP